MKIRIIVLNIKDGDAIIVLLSREDKHFIMLVDGGHSGDADMIIRELQPLLDATKHTAPDLILCTHYDVDHIGGLKKIIRQYGNEIGQVLIHKTAQILGILGSRHAHLEESRSVFPVDSDILLSADPGFPDTRQDGSMRIVLEGIRQEIELVDLIRQYGIASAEPIAGRYKNDDWQEIEILGPTDEYYQTLFPKHFDAGVYLQQELQELRAREDKLIPDVNLSPCSQLDALPKAGLTNTNLNSAIVRITIAGKAFLFAGDAGIASFKNIPGYQNILKNIFWLKVPHHGSRSNISWELISLMSPREAAISGYRYIDDTVIGCLIEVGANVRTTRDEGGHLVYEFDF